ncbi:MAG: ribosome silencing factor [Steroidobacteraceae bacterium]
MPANRKTSNGKSTDRANAVINPRAPGRSKAASQAKAASGPKASRKLRSADGGNLAPARPSLKSVVIDALADMKALEVKVLDVRGLTDVADFMVIASGTSDRHVRSVAQRVVERTKEAGFRPHGVEGQQDSDWVLIDLNEMIVHVMLPRVREFYGLEKLWDLTATKRAARA